MRKYRSKYQVRKHWGTILEQTMVHQEQYCPKKKKKKKKTTKKRRRRRRRRKKKKDCVFRKIWYILASYGLWQSRFCEEKRQTRRIPAYCSNKEVSYKYSIGHTTLNYHPTIKNLTVLLHIKFPGQ
jgi:hypothetical protein